MSKLSKYTDEELEALVFADIGTELKKRGYEYGWYKKQIYAGVIYILVNPAFPALVKIGYADDIEKRLRSLNRNSGLPDPYHCFATYRVKKRLEDLKLHSLIDTLDSDLRHTSNREFYEMSKNKAFGILQAIAEINGDENLLVRNPLNDEFFENNSDKEERSLFCQNEKQRKPKNINPKPYEVKFLITSANAVNITQSPFITWRQLESDICEQIIKVYGEKEFSDFVLDKNIKAFHTKKKHMFGVTTDLMIYSIKLSNGLYMNTNNSSDTIIRIVNLLVERFSKVQYELVYSKEESAGL